MLATFSINSQHVYLYLHYDFMFLLLLFFFVLIALICFTFTRNLMTIFNGGWPAASMGIRMKRITCSNITCTSSGPAM